MLTDPVSRATVSQNDHGERGRLHTTCETGILSKPLFVFQTFIHACILYTCRAPKGHVTLGCPYSSGHQSSSIQPRPSHETTRTGIKPDTCANCRWPSDIGSELWVQAAGGPMYTYHLQEHPRWKSVAVILLLRKEYQISFTDPPHTR